MKSVDQRLNNIIGQLEGVKKMMAGNCDCVKTLTQLKAIKSAVAGVMETIVEEKFDADKKLFVEMKKYVKFS